MRLSLLCPLLASTSLAAACGGNAPKTAQEVGDRVVAALVAKDWSAMKSLYWPIDAAKSACTDVPADKMDKFAAEFADELADGERDFKKCLEADWANAKVTAVAGGEASDGLKGCGDKAKEAKDIKVQVEVGGKKMEVKVNDPVLVGDQYFIIEGIRCKGAELSCDDVYENMVKIISAAPGAKGGEKDMFSGTPEKKAEFGKMCGEMRSDPRFTAIIECVGTAADYNAMKACEDKGKGEHGAESPPPTPDAPAEKPAEPAATAAATGSDACDKYIAKMSACAEAMPDAAKGPMKGALEQMKTSLAGRSADEKNAACGAALGAAKQAMAQMCPAVNWE